MDYSFRSIHEVTDTLIDYRGKTPVKAPSGIKLITAKVVKDGFIRDGNHEYIAAETYDARMNRGFPRQWDILITTEAPLGEVAQLRTNEAVALAQRIILLRGNASIIDQSYYFQCLKSPIVQNQLLARATGTTVLGIKQSELRQVGIPLYPLPTQRKIAAILSAYDDLIENNTRRIQILEEMAHALYREWFAHFRFPGHEGTRMVDSELGMIPEGWEHRSLFDLAEVTYGFPFKSSLFGGEGENGVIRIRDIRGNITHTFTAESPSDKYVVRNGDLLVGMDGEFHMGKWSGGRAYLNQRVVRFRPKSSVSSYYLHLALTPYIKNFEDTIVGTTVAHLGDRDLRSVKLLVPHEQLQKLICSILDPIFAQEISLQVKNQNLRQTRDLLLPRLISGEVDVADLDIKMDAEGAA